MDKLTNIEKILNSDMRYLYLALLISADSLNSKESCEDSLSILNFINDNIDNINVNNIDELKEFVKNGLEIVNRDLKFFS